MADLQDKVVLVTGAGAGIGRATALAMAEAGRDGRGGRHRPCRGAAHRERAAGNNAAGDRDRGRLRRCRQHRRDGGAHRRRIRPARRHRQQCRRYPLRPDHGPDRGGLGPHPPGQRQGRVLLPATRGASEMIAPGRRADRQHRLDFRPRLCRRLERRLCREQGRGHRPDQDGGAATRPPQHQRQRDLPRRHPHRTRRPQRRRARRRARHHRRRIAGRAGGGIPIGRANTPEDIAAMAVFLASPGARNITGQSYNVDGGLVPS